MKEIFNFPKIAALMVCAAALCSACNSVNSQKNDTNNLTTENSEKLNIANAAGSSKSKNTSPTPEDKYEIAKAGAEKLNSEPLPAGSTYRKVKPLTREEIRQSLIDNKLTGESEDGKIGGGKIVNFSHTCDLFIENKTFHVIHAPVIIQLASFSRFYNHVLIFDDSMKLIHDLNVSDPLFCDGNRLFFNDYEMAVPSPKRDGTSSQGNVLIFTNGAKDIEVRTASLNFYRFRDLIH